MKSVWHMQAAAPVWMLTPNVLIACVAGLDCVCVSNECGPVWEQCGPLVAIGTAAPASLLSGSGDGCGSVTVLKWGEAISFFPFCALSDAPWSEEKWAGAEGNRENKNKKVKAIRKRDASTVIPKFQRWEVVWERSLTEFSPFRIFWFPPALWCHLQARQLWQVAPSWLDATNSPWG